MPINSESDLAALVVADLEREKWEVYKEVLCTNSRFVCDIFAVKRNSNGRIIDSWAIETKMSFGLAVMEQAYNWRHYAHRISIAIPKSKSRRSRKFGYTLCNHLGLGIIEVGTRGSVSEKLPGKRRTTPKLPELHEDQKNYEAGNAAGSFWTPFKKTSQILKDYVIENPGVSLRDAIEDIEHHYKHTKSAEAALTNLITDGVIEGIRLRKIKGVKRLYPIK